MSPILGADGAPIPPTPKKQPQQPITSETVEDSSTAEASEATQLKKEAVPRPEKGDLLAAIYVHDIIEENGHSTVQLGFQSHAALSPMELLSIINQFGMFVQADAKKQMQDMIQVAPAGALDALKRQLPKS